MKQGEVVVARARRQQGKEGGRFSSGQSQYRGVAWNRSSNKWQSTVHCGKNVNIGHFTTQDEAAAAYDAATYIVRGR